jgi:OmpA-OmpF porin, OOP family
MVGAFLKKNSKLKVELNGWTDSRGTAKYNKALSQRRAEAIKKYLVEKFKIEEGRITAIGQGISTKYDNKTDEGRERNRRTEMTPVTTNKCQ